MCISIETILLLVTGLGGKSSDLNLIEVTNLIRNGVVLFNAGRINSDKHQTRHTTC